MNIKITKERIFSNFFVLRNFKILICIFFLKWE